jgi:L-malate glycosyltransferase
MRICYLADANSQHVVKWAEHFSLEHHDVKILSFRPSDDPGVQRLTYVLNSRWSTKIDSFIFAPRVRSMLATFQPDIVHAHYASSYGTLGRLSGFHPYVLSVWGSDVYDFPRRSWLHRKLVEKNLAAADHVCSTSENMAMETRRYCDSPITVTPFGVDCTRFLPALNQDNSGDEIVVGTIKGLEPPYGIEYLIRSFALLVKKYAGRKKLRLVIAGEGSLRKTLESVAKYLGIEKQVTFLGLIANSRVPELLTTFSVFCALSLSESFGVAVLEASACQIPVVVTNVGGLPEVVRDRVTGLIVSPRDIEEAASAISMLIEDEGLRHSLGAAGRRFVVENYNWSDNAKCMEKVYESVLRSNNQLGVSHGQRER